MSNANDARPLKVREYRDLRAGLRQALTSLKSAVGPAERFREAAWVRRAATELSNATCPRATALDREAAESLIDESASYLIAAGLTHGDAERILASN